MSDHPIDKLIYIFSKLPGLGTRSARRIVLHLISDKETRINSLIDILNFVKNNLNKCKYCNNIDYGDICTICKDHKRDKKIIAVVETIADLWAIERSKIFNGIYYVIGKNYSNFNSSIVEADISKLMNLCKINDATEVIIATNSTINGQTLFYQIIDHLEPLNIKISRLATGIPVGGEIDYLDEGTLAIALETRKNF